MESTNQTKRLSPQVADYLTTETPAEQKPGNSKLSNGKPAAARHYGSLQKQPVHDKELAIKKIG
jgi:hypothetical protein